MSRSTDGLVGRKLFGIAVQNRYLCDFNERTMKLRFRISIVFLVLSWSVTAQQDEAFFIKKIHDAALTQGKAYDWLHHLSKGIGGRLSGSPAAMAAVEYTRQMLDTLLLDSVFLQPCMVPHWTRGEREQVRVVNSKKMGSVDLPALALGNSIGTGSRGLTAEVIEVRSLEELERIGRAEVEGKIVFFNRAFDPTQVNTFSGYGGAVDQRVFGASRASKLGAVGAVVRSMTPGIDDFPHTGSMVYEEGVAPVPALGISTRAADLLSMLMEEERIHLFLRNTSQMLAEKQSYNVIGEIRGAEHPDEIILVGGHLDSWDVGEGAHDDGAGCVQAMDVLQILKRVGYRPKRTIRCVLFMNEENGLRGALKYQEETAFNDWFHLAAIESDRGGFTPRGFTCDGADDTFNKLFRNVTRWLPLLEPYGLSLTKGGSGADISGLKNKEGLLFGLYPDSQRYFDYHHAASDTFEMVNRRELQLGAAAMTSLVYLIDKYGLE